MNREEKIDKALGVYEEASKGYTLSRKAMGAIVDALEEPKIGVWGKFWNECEGDAYVYYGELEEVQSEDYYSYKRKDGVTYAHYKPIPGLKEFLEEAGEI